MTPRHIRRGSFPDSSEMRSAFAPKHIITASYSVSKRPDPEQHKMMSKPMSCYCSKRKANFTCQVQETIDRLLIQVQLFSSTRLFHLIFTSEVKCLKTQVTNYIEDENNDREQTGARAGVYSNLKILKRMNIQCLWHIKG